MPLSRSVAGILLNDKRLLIAKRLPGGDMGGRWEFPGGKVEVFEDDKVALIREFREELDITIKVGRLLASGQFKNHGHEVVLNAYEVFSENYNFRLVDHSEWRWVSPDELNTYLLADSDRTLIPDIKRSLADTIGSIF